MPKTVRLLALLVLGLVGVALVAACGGEEEAAVPQVAVGASEYAFASPDSIAGGLVQLNLNNTGKEDHHAQLVRLNDGVTLPQFQQALQEAVAAQFQGPAVGKVFAAVTFQGGPATTKPGKSTAATLNLSQGSYAMLCFVGDPQGVPHIAKGMIKPFTVTAAAAAQPTPPKAAGTVDLNDFAFTAIPTDLKVGKHTWAVTNKGKEIHEMGMLKLKAPAADVQKILSAPPPAPGSAPPAGPPPFEDAGGFQAIMPGMTGWTTVELEKGDYALVCFVPSPANQGKPHVALGMFRPFTVK
jgi:uncharacterized cupredoxin-like copper-binding protein